MRKWMLAASAAALAMTGPAFAEKGGHGNGGGHGKAQMQQGGKGDRGPGMSRAEHHGREAGRMEQRLREHGRPERTEIREVRKEYRDAGRRDFDRRDVERTVVRAGRVDQQIARETRGDWDRRDDDVRFAPRWDSRGLTRYDGCPPGLAKKGNGCMPPGLAKKVVGTTLPAALASNVLGGPYRDWYRDDDRYFYRSDADYIYRVQRDGGLIDALFPTINRDYYYYPVGYSYPTSYNYYNVPYQYRTYYPDGGDTWYRYGDGAIYSVNPTDGLITGIASLLAGDLGVGQPLPSAYSVYNVPLSYRDRYYDTPDDWYRYNDGYIYRVDPKTQLITAIISALV